MQTMPLLIGLAGVKCARMQATDRENTVHFSGAKRRFNSCWHQSVHLHAARTHTSTQSQQADVLMCACSHPSVPCHYLAHCRVSELVSPSNPAP